MKGAFAILYLACCVAAGCTTTHAADLRPDLSGVWNVAYDDFIEGEVSIGKQVRPLRLGHKGGQFVTSYGGTTLRLNVDCSREELICPNEVWPGELKLTNRIGGLDETGEILSVSLASEGQGPCVLQGGSQVRARVDALGSASTGNWQAIALTGARVTTVMSGACVGVGRGLGSLPIRIALSTGLSAVRRQHSWVERRAPLLGDIVTLESELPEVDVHELND